MIEVMVEHELHELAATANSAADEVHEHMRSGVAAAIQAGEKLAQAATERRAINDQG